MKHKPESVSLILPAVERTAEGLRDALFDELNALRAGKVDTRHARTISLLAKQIIDAAHLELAHELLFDRTRRSLRLGHGKK